MTVREYIHVQHSEEAILAADALARGDKVVAAAAQSKATYWIGCLATYKDTLDLTYSGHLDL